MRIARFGSMVADRGAANRSPEMPAVLGENHPTPEEVVGSFQPTFDPAGRCTSMVGSWRTPDLRGGGPDCQLVNAAIDRLPEPFRSVYLLRDGMGMSIEAIADHTGMTTEEAARLVHRARCALVGLLDPCLRSCPGGTTTPLGRMTGTIMKHLSTLRSAHMNTILVRIVLPILGSLAIVAAGVAFAQAGSAPGRVAAPAAQPDPADRSPSEVKRPAAALPKVISLQLYADWCPACKTLKPKLEAALKEAAGQPLLLVRLDETDKDSRQAEYLLAALGLGDLWKDHAGKTGYVLLVDASTKKVIGNISFRFEVKEITEALTKAIKDASK